MTWLYIPPSCLSAQDTADWTSESESPAQVLERSVLWRSKRLPLRSWLRVWEKAPWLQLLFGVTLPPSTATRGVERFLSSLPDFPVSHTHLPANDAEPTTHATCGHTLPASWERCGLPWCSSKTFQGYLALHFVDAEKTFKDWVTGLRSAYSARRKSARATNGSASSSWPTPRSHDGTAGPGMMRERGKKTGLDLQDAVKNWNTPRARDWKEAGKDCLPSDAATWATSSLPDLKTWTDGEPTSMPADPPRRRLNPDFVQALMGLPSGWTDFER